jgi:hypothetical protein
LEYTALYCSYDTYCGTIIFPKSSSVIMSKILVTHGSFANVCTSYNYKLPSKVITYIYNCKLSSKATYLHLNREFTQHVQKCLEHMVTAISFQAQKISANSCKYERLHKNDKIF